MAIHSNYNKFWAIRTTLDGITFDSKKESERYAELLLMQKWRVIKDLVLQPSFVLLKWWSVNQFWKTIKVRPITYVADFSYVEVGKPKPIVEDVKWLRTDVYVMKRKLFLAIYGHEFDHLET